MNETANRRVLAESEYLWVQGLREQAGVSPEQLADLDLDAAAYEELLADFVDRALQAKPQIEQLQRRAMQAKRAQRNAMRATMTGERGVTKAEYEGLVKHHHHCNQECLAGVAAVGQQAGIRVGLDLKRAKSERFKGEAQRARQQLDGRVANRQEIQETAQRKQLQHGRVMAAEAVVLPVPESLVERGFEEGAFAEGELEAESTR